MASDGSHCSSWTLILVIYMTGNTGQDPRCAGAFVSVCVKIPSPRPLVLDALRSEWLSAFIPSLYLDSVIELWAFPEKFQVIDAYVFYQPLVLSDFQISGVFETESNWRANPLFKQRFVGPPHFGVLVSVRC